MTVRELRDQLEAFDDDMEVVIGMQQTHGTNFVMEIENNLDEYNVTVFDGEDCRAVVITEGSQIGSVDYSMKIIKIIGKIDSLFKNFNRDSRKFSVDYDQTTGGIYCNYAPYSNDNGFAVSKDLLIIDETSQADLKRLKDWLDKNGINSRSGCEWDWIWG